MHQPAVPASSPFCAADHPVALALVVVNSRFRTREFRTASSEPRVHPYIRTAGTEQHTSTENTGCAFGLPDSTPFRPTRADFANFRGPGNWPARNCRWIQGWSAPCGLRQNPSKILKVAAVWQTESTVPSLRTCEARQVSPSLPEPAALPSLPEPRLAASLNQPPCRACPSPPHCRACLDSPHRRTNHPAELATSQSVSLPKNFPQSTLNQPSPEELPLNQPSINPQPTPPETGACRLLRSGGYKGSHRSRLYFGVSRDTRESLRISGHLRTLGPSHTPLGPSSPPGPISSEVCTPPRPWVCNRVG